MAFLDWLRGILVVVLFGWLLEALQPVSALRRYTRLAIGLLLMVAILRPAVSLLQGSLPRLSGNFWTDRDVQGLLQQGVFVQQREEAAALAQYQGDLRQVAKGAAEAVLGRVPLAASVTVGAHDAPAAADLRVGAAGTADSAQRVQAAVGQALGISPAAVRVEWDKGGIIP